jgi:hypothetical protein
MAQSSTRTEQRTGARKAAFLALRYGLPGVVILTGAIIWVIWDSIHGFHAFIALLSAGLSILLFNVLYRFGAAGDRDRRQEDAARAFFDKHGYWPDERR